VSAIRAVSDNKKCNSLVLSGIALGKKVRKNFYTARLEQ
jgi:hypothetical protein